MDVLVLIGRILFVALFLGGGVHHLTERKQMVDYANSMKVPSAQALVPITGVQLLVGGLMVLLGIWADLGMLLLAAFLIPTALLMHPFWKIEDEQEKGIQMAMFMKNIALAGAAIVMMAMISFLGPALDLTLTDPLFEIN